MSEAKRIGTIAHGLVVAMIQSAPDDTVRKRRIMIAREEGILTEQEAEDWLALLELRAA